MPFGTPEVRADIGSDHPRSGRRPVRPRQGDEGRLPDRPGDEGRPARLRARGRAPPARPRPPRSSSTLGASRDLLIVDEENVLWRWRPADDAGAGTTTRVARLGQRRLGRRHPGDRDVPARRQRRPLQPLRRRPVRADQILVYYPASDGSGFPADPIDRLAVARDVSKVDSLYIDSDIFVADDGTIIRFVDGRAEGWETDELPDALLREQPRLLADRLGERQADRRHLRLRQGERARRRDRQGQGHVPRAVPPRRGGSGLGGHPRACTSSLGRRGRPGDARLGDQRRPLLVDPRGRSGRRTGVAPRRPLPDRVRRGRARRSSHRRRRPRPRRDPAPGREPDPAHADRHDRADRRLRRRLRLHAGRRVQPGHRGRPGAVRDVRRRPGRARRGLVGGPTRRAGDAGGLHEHVPAREPGSTSSAT